MTEASPELIMENGVLVHGQSLSDFSAFEQAYLRIRSTEKRVLSPEQVRVLPYCNVNDPDAGMWTVRRKTIDRFMAYLKDKPALKILEIGCGNGYFSNLLAKKDHDVTGLDVNLTELKLAFSAFGHSVKWICLDVMKNTVPGEPFDLIVFNASFHYFGAPVQLLERCRDMLRAGGEIHILDSHFYTPGGKSRAKQRSDDYFRKSRIPEMTAFYHHNEWNVLRNTPYDILYRPKPLLQRLMRKSDSPFHWIRIRNEKAR